MKIESVFIPRLNQSVTYHVGQNAKDNFAVIDSAESSLDIWFHAAQESSCHVVCLVPPNIDKKARQLIIKQGALLCKMHTPKLRSLKNADIIYTEIRNVKKNAVDGQVYLEGAFKKESV